MTTDNTTRPTIDELAEMKAIAQEVDALRAKYSAIENKYKRCFECGAWEGDRHDKDCDMAYCDQCGKPINDTSARGCKCANPISCEFDPAAYERF